MAAGRQAESTETGRKEGGRSLVYIQGVLCGGLAAFAMPMALLVLALVWPGLVTLKLDHMPGKPLARAMLLAGLAGAIGPARDLLRGGMTISAALDLLADPIVLAVAWGAAAFAWLLAEAIPLIVEIVEAARSARRITELEETRARLTERWGLAPTTKPD